MSEMVESGFEPHEVGEEVRAAGEFASFPGSPFQLFMPYPPAGDQPRAIDGLVEGINDGLSFQTLLGVTGSGKTFTMANVIARLGRPALVFAPNKTLAAQLYAEFREFFPKNAVEYFVSYYDYYQPEAYVPQRDLFIEKDSAINEHIEQMRLSATKSLLERRDVIIVASVSAIYGIGAPADYTEMRLILRTGAKAGQRDLIAHLIRMQYKRNDTDFVRGTFRVRGDTVDVFPAEHSELAIRIELFDDEVESLALFDPLTGRIRQKVPRFVVYPATHYVTPRAQVVSAVDGIKEELRQRVAEFVGQGKLVEAQRIEQRTRFDLEMLQEIGHCKGIENYTRHLSGRGAGQPAGDAGRLSAARRADLPRREPRHDRPARRHVQRRPGEEDDAGRLRLPPALGARQPAAALRGVRSQDAPGGVRLGHAGRLRERARRPGRRAARAADRAGRPGGRGAAGARPGRRRAAGDPRARHRRRPRARHRAHQAHGRAAHRLPGGQRRQGALPAQRHRHGGARRDPARPAAGHLRRAGRHQPAARGARHPRGVAGRHPRRRQGGLPARRAQPDPDHRPRGAQPQRQGDPLCRPRHRFHDSGRSARPSAAARGRSPSTPSTASRRAASARRCAS